ncbi:MAG TPA: sugar phosphate isomerase/epimerase [Bryobacteraceae bacterium]|nr:sugar phosphate isomerase/epimerase [Bryobacteraceae bacterium]
MTRRHILGAIAAVPAATRLVPAAPQERYKLGVMATMFSPLALDDAMTRIRKMGYRYISMGARHGTETVYSPEMTKPERAKMLRRIRDLGVQPFMSLGGFRGDPLTVEGLDRYIAQLDLCADYEIPVMVGAGPWYFTKFPTVPKRERDWQEEVTRFYVGLEKALRHAESVKVVIALKPHTGITARAKDCLDVLKRLRSPYFKIAWDAGNISYYEGIYPDPDLPDLAPQVCSVCLKDHKGLRGVNDFPVPGQGNIDHEGMFRTLFAAGFNGPMSIERVDGTDGGMNKVPPAVVEERLTAAYKYLAPLLDRVAPGA